MKNIALTTRLLLGICSLGLLGCAQTVNSTIPKNDDVELTAAARSSSLFQKTNDVIPFENAMRRKWGAAIVSDLDQDGWEDVIVTHHGAHARVFWNNKGIFSHPTEFVKGDTHGLGVSDYDADGKIDIIVAQGGGDGGNPKRPLKFVVNDDRSISKIGAYDDFELARGRSVKFLDSDKDSNLDLFLTGYAPKNAKSLSTNHLYLNRQRDLSFSKTLPLPHDALSFKALTTDVNNDGNVDIIVHGGSDLRLSLGNGDGSYKDGTDEVFGDLAKTSFVISVTEIDYDNDGDFDLFLSRAKFQFEEETYYNPNTQDMAFFAFRDEFMFEEIQVEGKNLKLDNIQETWATYDIRLGSKKNIVETKRDDNHMGGSLTISPEDAMGWPNSEDSLEGLHIGYIGEGKWRMGGYVKSRLGVVVRNVQSHPKEQKRAPLPAKFLENRDGKFFDVSRKLGIDLAEQTTHAAAGDFNNDGFMDLAITPYGNMAYPVDHIVYMNQQGKAFQRHNDAGLNSEEIGATGVGVTTIDYDQDGKLDLIFGNERGRWYLAQNNLKDEESGDFITVHVAPSPQGKSAPIGARVDVSACGKKWNQLVGASGEGYHHMLKNRLHFGLGNCDHIDSIKITWSSGEQKKINNVKAGSIISSVN